MASVGGHTSQPTGVSEPSHRSQHWSKRKARNGLGCVLGETWTCSLVSHGGPLTCPLNSALRGHCLLTFWLSPFSSFGPCVLVLTQGFQSPSLRVWIWWGSVPVLGAGVGRGRLQGDGDKSFGLPLVRGHQLRVQALAVPSAEAHLLGEGWGAGAASRLHS